MPLSNELAKTYLGKNSTQLWKLNGKVDPKGMWAAVRQLTGSKRQPVDVDDVDAHSLNKHYATISTDLQYRCSVNKQSHQMNMTMSIYLNMRCLTFLINFGQQPLDWTSCLPGFSDSVLQFSANRLHVCLIIIIIIKRQFVRRRNMSVDITRAP